MCGGRVGVWVLCIMLGGMGGPVDATQALLEKGMEVCVVVEEWLGGWVPYIMLGVESGVGGRVDEAQVLLEKVAQVEVGGWGD